MIPGPGIARTPLPEGFLASGLNSGVRRYRPDVGLLVSEVPCLGVGVFTRNTFKAAPVRYCESLLPSNRIRAIITNSGQANAATGERGERTNIQMVQAVADALGCLPSQVLAASTGPIGVQLEIEKIIAVVPELVARQGKSAESFALAILTTDLVPKTVSTVLELSHGSIRITGICKGSGMIHPHMATMLGYIVTDAGIESAVAEGMLRSVTDRTFNMISVDGESSTNDCVFLLANGASGVQVENAEDKAKFENALFHVSAVLAQSIARDGEGATKLLEVRVTGAPDIRFARTAARSLVVSPLVKTAMHGGDPNWGRIVARLGGEELPREILELLKLKIQDVAIFDSGAPLDIDLERLRLLLREDTIRIAIDCKSGEHEATAWGCDLSKKYVEINAEYLT